MTIFSKYSFLLFIIYCFKLIKQYKKLQATILEKIIHFVLIVFLGLYTLNCFSLIGGIIHDPRSYFLEIKQLFYYLPDNLAVILHIIYVLILFMVFTMLIGVLELENRAREYILKLMPVLIIYHFLFSFSIDVKNEILYYNWIDLFLLICSYLYLNGKSILKFIK